MQQTTPVRSVQQRHGVLRAPLDRNAIDRAAPWLRLLAGAGLIAWSSYTTVAGVGSDFAPILAGKMAFGMDATLVVGLLVALFLSLGEWLTSEHIPILYSALLILDARYTELQIGPWVDALVGYHLRGASQWVPGVVSFLLSWGLSLVIARYGEILLFGRRRQETR